MGNGKTIIKKQRRENITMQRRRVVRLDRILQAKHRKKEMIELGRLVRLQGKIIFLPKSNGFYTNRKLSSNEIYYRYHGIHNRLGERFGWLTNKKYPDELSLRSDLAIRDDWGVKIEMVTEIEVPSGTWISEGYAAHQGKGYTGGGYQAIILEIPKNWIKTTKRAFKNE